MVIEKQEVTDKQKEYCAVSTMRRMCEKYAEENKKTFDEVFLEFAKSPIYEALFDYETCIWREGPDYLMALYEESKG